MHVCTFDSTVAQIYTATPSSSGCTFVFLHWCIWHSFGILMFELFTNVAPYADVSAKEILRGVHWILCGVLSSWVTHIVGGMCMLCLACAYSLWARVDILYCTSILKMGHAFSFLTDFLFFMHLLAWRIMCFHDGLHLYEVFGVHICMTLVKCAPYIWMVCAYCAWVLLRMSHRHPS